MGKAEAGSAKAIGNAIKAKGLGRLRWYCQICEKQCRDENGFQAHCKSEPHMRKIMLVGPKAGSAISEYSNQFRSEFMLLLRTRHQTNRVRANVVYNEYIQDKHHVHMNATNWVTLSGFIQTLGKEGVVKVDEDDKGLWITWVDNRPETLARQAAAQKKDRATMDGEERERKMLAEQIARARAQADASAVEEQNVGLQKKEGEKISLNLFGPVAEGDFKPDTNGEAGPSSSTTAETASATAPTSIGIGSSTSTAPKSTFGSFSTPASKPAVNPLKRPAPMNVFKSGAKAAKTESDTGGKKFMSEAERLMKEDQARKSRSNGGGAGGGGGYKGFGPSRGGR